MSKFEGLHRNRTEVFLRQREHKFTKGGLKSSAVVTRNIIPLALSMLRVGAILIAASIVRLANIPVDEG